MTAVIPQLCITSCVFGACHTLRPWLECYLFLKASLIPLIPTSQRLPWEPSTSLRSLLPQLSSSSRPRGQSQGPHIPGGPGASIC